MGLLGKQQPPDPKTTDSSIRVRTGNLRDSAAERDDFALYVSKSVPQRLKPSTAQAIYGTAEAVPFVRQSSPASKGQ
jgi:hypothetical protein